MTETDKKQILESYKQQFDALCKQRGFSEDMLEHYAREIVNFGVVDIPNFYSLGHRDDLAVLCRQFLKFNDMYERVCKDVSSCSSEISIIKDLK